MLAAIIKYIPLQQGLRPIKVLACKHLCIIKYIPLQQGLRHEKGYSFSPDSYIIKYIPLQQGLRHKANTIWYPILVDY